MLTLIPALCSSLQAEDLLTPGEQVLRELRGALTAGKQAESVTLLAEVGRLYQFPGSPSEAEALLALAGEATRSKDPVVACAALLAVGGTGASTAVPFVKPHLRLRPGNEAQTLAAVQAAGRIRAGSLIAPLLDLAKASADMTVADQAFLALGEFATAPLDVRKRVVERVLSICQSAKKNRKRWRRLRAPALRALQRLIGRRLNSVQQFEDWWRFAKTRKDPFAKR